MTNIYESSFKIEVRLKFLFFLTAHIFSSITRKKEVNFPLVISKEHQLFKKSKIFNSM